MILSYGQDDRVCAFSSLHAFLNVPDVNRTACLILTDKEEIGSVGATGMKSLFFENVIAKLTDHEGDKSFLAVRECLANSCMLSSDVNAAFDPSYASVFDKRNASRMGEGMVLSKYTGSRGKSGSNDANAEFIAYLRKTFDDAKVLYQMAELGKVDAGGGGTIAYIMADYGMNVIDAGVAILNMHAPYEASSKADVYETMRGYTAFLKAPGF
jgi:aspartyl aminopeptidase